MTYRLIYHSCNPTWWLQTPSKQYSWPCDQTINQNSVLASFASSLLPHRSSNEDITPAALRLSSHHYWSSRKYYFCLLQKHYCRIPLNLWLTSFKFRMAQVRTFGSRKPAVCRLPPICSAYLPYSVYPTIILPRTWNPYPNTIFLSEMTYLDSIDCIE